MRGSEPVAIMKVQGMPARSRPSTGGVVREHHHLGHRLAPGRLLATTLRHLSRARTQRPTQPLAALASTRIATPRSGQRQHTKGHRRDGAHACGCLGSMLLREDTKMREPVPGRRHVSAKGASSGTMRCMNVEEQPTSD